MAFYEQRSALDPVPRHGLVSKLVPSIKAQQIPLTAAFLRYTSYIVESLSTNNDWRWVRNF